MRKLLAKPSKKNVKLTILHPNLIQFFSSKWTLSKIFRSKKIDPENFDGKIVKCCCFTNLNTLNLVLCQKLNLRKVYIIKQSNSELRVNFINRTITKCSMQHR